MTTIEFHCLSKERKAIAFYAAHNRKSGMSYFAFICESEDRDIGRWVVHTYSTALRIHREYHFITLYAAKEFIGYYLI